MYWDDTADSLIINSAASGTAAAAITWIEGLNMSAAGASLFQVANDAGSCTSAKLGRLRYNGTSTWEYCNGTTWTSLSSGGGGGTPAGSNMQIQFNSGGAFAATSNFVWNNSTAKMTITGDIDYNGTITDTSDIRLKENIREVGPALEKIVTLEPIAFSMKNDPKHATEFGFSAQELQKVYPDLVRTADDEAGTLSVNYIGLIAPLVQAVKDLEQENEVLRQRLDAVEKKIDSGNQQ